MSILIKRAFWSAGCAISLAMGFGPGRAMAQRPLGIDVADYQGMPDWPEVADAGISFAWAKATEGTYYVDDDFTYDEENGVAAGIFIGAYHYPRPDLDIGVAGADAEAAYFWNVAEPYIQNGGVYLMPMLDWEPWPGNTTPGSNYTISTSSQWVNEWCQDIVDYAAADGVVVKPVVYSYVSYAQDWLDSSVTQWPLWMSDAKNGENPQTGAPRYTGYWTSWAFWQYGGDDFAGNTADGADVDIFNGTTNQLLNYVIGTTTGPPTVTVYPASLTERVGDHVAFNVVLETGGLSLNYQWYFVSGGATNSLTGQTGSSLVLANIQTTNAGTYLVVVGNMYGTATNSATLNVSTANLPLPATNLEVLRVGDGAQVLSSATGNTIYLDQYTTNGTYISTIQIPDTSAGASYGTGSAASVFGSPSLIIPGDSVEAENHGFLTLSYNQRYLCFAGYCLSYPYSGMDCTSPGTGGNRWRGLGEVNASGSYTLAYTNTGLYDGGNHTIRSMVSLDGVTNFWTTGQSGSLYGLKYVNSTVSSYANGSGIPSDDTSTKSGTRVVQILSNSNLVYSDTDANPPGIYWNTGSPEPRANGSFTSSLLINEGGVPNDFVFSPDLQTVYIADGGTTNTAGGIERWDTTTPGSNYVFSYTLEPGSGTGAAAQGLTAVFPTNIASWGPNITGAILYATTYGIAGNSLVQMVDTGAASVPTVLATAGPNVGFRGVRFGPTDDLPIISWATPGSINYGTALSAAQLDATANVSGSFVYTPTNGAILPVGTNTLSVQFTPSDTNNYLVVTASVSLVVLPGTLPTLNASLVGVANVQFQFGSAAPGANYVLQYTTNLSPPVTWQPFVTNAADSNGNWTFTLINATGFPAMFFRVAIP
jgi:GH25 family lysozyme M1 (1,4-beta-N-acetylmuramidase)